MHAREDGRGDGATATPNADGTPTGDLFRAPRISVVDTTLSLLSALFTIAGIVCLVALINARNESARVRDVHDECVNAATELMEASDDLTSSARLYALTGEPSYLNEYLDELLNAKRRDTAVETLRRNADGTRAARMLSEALDDSNRLAERELYAMRLTAESQGMKDMPEELTSITLDAADRSLSAKEKAELGRQMVIDETYAAEKALIIDKVNECFGALVDDLATERAASLAKERQLQVILMVSLIMDALLMVANEVAGHVLLLRPMRRHSLAIRHNEPLEIFGCQEIRSVAASYNHLFDENLKRTTLLRRQATTDALTGLLNRGSFDSMLDREEGDVALIITDVDLFKSINDSGGHEVGDRVLKKVAHALSRQFRTTDYVCRIGGDEFAVILTEMPRVMRDVVERKLNAISAELADTEDGLPPVTLSAGIAFSAMLPKGTNLYRAADEALYETKRRGRNGHTYYEGG